MVNFDRVITVYMRLFSLIVRVIYLVHLGRFNRQRFLITQKNIEWASGALALNALNIRGAIY